MSSESAQIIHPTKEQALDFLETCETFLSEIAQTDEISLSKEQIQRYRKPKVKLENLTLQTIFLRLAKSAANRHMLKNVIEFSDKMNRNDRILEAISGQKQLATKSFSDEVFKPHLQKLAVVKVDEALCNLRQDPGLIKSEKTTLWERWLKSVSDAAAFMLQYESGQEFVHHFQSLAPEDRSAGPLLIARNVKWVGFALACDALKELGFTQFIKPDTHLIDVFCALNLAKNKQLSVFDAATSMVQTINSDRPKEKQITAYELDKIIWLCCSGTFYNEKKQVSKGVRDLKQELIDRLQTKFPQL